MAGTTNRAGRRDEDTTLVRTGSPGLRGAVGDFVRAVGGAAAPRSVTQIKQRQRQREEQVTAAVPTPRTKRRFFTLSNEVTV